MKLTKIKINVARLLALPAILIVAFMFTCCSSDDSKKKEEAYECEACTDTPDALAIHDGSIKGIYKGIFVGSTGSITIDIQNGSNNITATMVIDGETVQLTSTVQVVDGEPYIAPFTGTMNGQPVSIVFSVGLSGSTPTVTSSDIPGHPNAVFEVFKETSTSLLEAFEGEYSTSDGKTGTFNILLSRALAKWGAIAREDGEVETDNVNGTINNNNQLVEEVNGTVMGTITGDELHGSFEDSHGATVTIHGERTL